MNKLSNPQNVVTEASSDSEIISRVLAGEKDYYALLIQKYNQRLYRIGFSILNDDAEVEEVMQVAYIKAYENLKSFEGRSSFITWLTRILINECYLRNKKRKQIVEMSEQALGEKINETARTESPYMKVVNTELKNAIETAISQLPEKYRTVFVMREIESMSVAETQQCLDLTEVNVKVRLNRAKAMLRTSLNSFYKKEDILHFHLNRCSRMVSFVMDHINRK